MAPSQVPRTSIPQCCSAIARVSLRGPDGPGPRTLSHGKVQPRAPFIRNPDWFQSKFKPCEPKCCGQEKMTLRPEVTKRTCKNEIAGNLVYRRFTKARTCPLHVWTQNPNVQPTEDKKKCFPSASKEKEKYFLRANPTVKHDPNIASDIPSGSIYVVFILTFYLASILTYFLAYLLTFFLAFYLPLYLRRFFVVDVRRGTL